MFKDLLLFIKNYGKGRKLQIIIFMLVSFFVGILDFIGIGLVYPFFIMIISPKDAVNYSFYERISQYSCLNSQETAIFIGFTIIILMILVNIVMIIYFYFQNKFIINWKTDLNRMLMNYYLKVSYKKILKTTLAEKMYNLTTLLSHTLEIFVMRSFTLMTHLIIVFVILFLFCLKFKNAAIIGVVVLCVSMFLINFFFKRKTDILAPKMLEYTYKNNDKILETLNNLKEIRLQSKEEKFLDDFAYVQKAYNDIIFKNAFYAGIPSYVVSIIFLFLTLFFAIFVLNYENSDISKIIAMYALMAVVVVRLAPLLNKIQISLNNINSVKELVKKANAEYELNHFDEIAIKHENGEVVDFKEELELTGINFGYNENENVLKNVNLKINKCEIFGIIGSSGAGKSTLADIISCILPFDSGKYKVDGIEITKNNVCEFRKKFAYACVDAELLQGSYADNVVFCEEKEKIDENKIKECLRDACLLDYVESKCGIWGKIDGLSQGQKQRLLIARALYKDSEIIIFDEATSSLDISTENEIMKMLKNLKKKKTIIVISHRMTTLKECDRIAFIKSGEIVDIGDLQGLKERYSEIEEIIKLSQI